ncbi:MAG: RecQ family ATP-dependent DNA helicase, partial [Candidatus Eremiobacterota bacterium]
AREFLGGYDRPNIRYAVVLKDQARKQLLQFLQGRPRDESGIVYCLSRRKVEEVSRWLAEHGYAAVPYHAGLDAATRNAHQERFARESRLIVVATIAFGMGIDKPDVRFVAHLDMPRSIEAYYQETGRAGRDGLPAEAWMAYGLADVVTLRQLSAQSQADEAFKRVEQRRLNALLGYCETVRCRRQVLLEYFSDSCEPCGNCDTCLVPVETWDGTLAAQKALSAAFRTGQRFGAGYLTDVLRGHETDRIRSLGHQRLPTFGVGKELDERQWGSVFRQLVAGGYLAVDMAGHGSLGLTPRSKPLLKGEQRMLLRRDPVRPPRPVRKAAAPSAGDVDPRLWEALRACRRELAATQGLPPYCVLHDSSLLEMARRRPTTRAELASIPGWGEVKLARYADAFLDVLGTAMSWNH